MGSYNVGFRVQGSWVVLSMAISPLIWVISIVTLLITQLITTHEPPSRASGFGFRVYGLGFRGLGWRI